MKLALGIDLGHPSHKITCSKMARLYHSSPKMKIIFPLGPREFSIQFVAKIFQENLKVSGEEWKEKVCHPPGDYYSHTKVTKIILCSVLCNSFRCSSFLVH